MAQVSRRVPLVLLMGLAFGCGGKSEASPATHPNTDSSRGSGLTSNAGSAQGGGASVQAGGASVQAGAASVQGGAGSGGVAPKRCESVDGLLSYGPIGEPRPLPLETVASGEFPHRSWARHVFGFRTAAGYRFVWEMAKDTQVPEPNLFSLNVGANFELGSAPRALVAENSAYDLDLVPGPNGFVATTCSRESKPEWIQLNGDLDVVQGANFSAPDVPCEDLAPSVLWTGEVYLTSYSDSRGLVVASLDERGAVVKETVVGQQNKRWVRPRFAKNGDRVLFVFAGDKVWYAVFDLRGGLLGEVQPMGKENTEPRDLAIAPNRDGWWVVTSVEPSYKVADGVRLTKISEDGLSSPELTPFGWGHQQSFIGFTPSAYGGFLLVLTRATRDESFRTIARIDDKGKVVCYQETEDLDATSRPIAIVSDPLRDLIVEDYWGDNTAVQEYGYLN